MSFLLKEKRSPRPKVDPIDITKGIKKLLGGMGKSYIGFCLSGRMNMP